MADSGGRRPASPETHRRLARALLQAFESGDLAPLVTLLREDAALVSDGGGEVPAARQPILGRDRILRFFAGVRGRLPAGLRPAPAEVNGAADAGPPA